jgi:hypothetical protein
MQARQKRLSTHCWTMKRVSCASWTTCEKWPGDKLEECQLCPQHSLLTSIGWRAAIGAKRDHNATLSALAASCEGSESFITLFAGSNDLHLHEDFRLDQLSNDLEHERRSNIA